MKFISDWDIFVQKIERFTKETIHNYIIPKFTFSKVVTKDFSSIQTNSAFQINIEQWSMQIFKNNIVNFVSKRNNTINSQAQMRVQAVDVENVV